MARITIAGAGGAGGLVGGLLAEAGHEVVFLARGANADALRTRGLELRDPKGASRVIRPAAVEESAAAAGRSDYVFVAVKAFQVAALAPTLQPLVEPGRTLVVPLQNSLVAAEELAAGLGEEPVLGGLCYLVAELGSPGVVLWQGTTPNVTFGPRHPSQLEGARRLHALLERAGLKAVLADDPRVAVWTKLLFVASFGAIGALANAPLGETLHSAEWRPRMEQMMREYEAVARADGVALPADVVHSALKKLETFPAETTASLQRDLAAGRPSELEQQVGAVVRLAQSHGVEVPVTARAYETLRPERRGT